MAVSKNQKLKSENLFKTYKELIHKAFDNKRKRDVIANAEKNLNITNAQLEELRKLGGQP